MNILVIGGTRLMGMPCIRALLEKGHQVTIANRGLTKDPFPHLPHIILERTDADSIKKALDGKYFDVVFDHLAYCSNDVRALLSTLSCGRYVMISTTSLYDKHMETVEEDFDPLQYPLKWCSRGDYPYGEIKRSAECALFQAYPEFNAAAIRFPFVISRDDYTKRLYFYVRHIVQGKAIYVDNFDAPMGFIHAEEAGRFLASFAENDFRGVVNGANFGTISIKEVADYVAEKTGKQAILAESADAVEAEDIAPYNGEPAYSIVTKRAESLGFSFRRLDSYIYDLLGEYIAMAEAER